ncbi:MAG: hypothetical protein WA673_19870 [Candidatus Acidiferrales bacterium]
MDLKTILKWGVILLVIYFAWQWITNQFSGGGIVGSGYSTFPAPYAAPIPSPYSGVVGWAAPWQYAASGIRYGGRPRRFKR